SLRVGAERHMSDGVGVPVKYLLPGSGLQIPDDDGVILAARGQKSAIAPVTDTAGWTSVSGQAVHFLSCGHVPDADRSPVVGQCQLPAVWAESRTPDDCRQSFQAAFRLACRRIPDLDVTDVLLVLGIPAVREGDQTSPVGAIEQLHHTSRLSIQIERILHVFLQGPHRLNGNDDSGPRTPLDGGPQWLAAFGQLRNVIPQRPVPGQRSLKLVERGRVRFLKYPHELPVPVVLNEEMAVREPRQLCPSSPGAEIVKCVALPPRFQAVDIVFGPLLPGMDAEYSQV